MARFRLRPPDARLFRWLYAVGLGPLVGRVVLLLTTTGRRSGRPRHTPLQYEVIGAELVLGSARGLQADWVRNLQRDPRVHVRLGRLRFSGVAEVVSSAHLIADFLEVRLARRPRMIGAILRSEGLPAQPEREQLEAYAARLAIVRIRPSDEGLLPPPPDGRTLDRRRP